LAVGVLAVQGAVREHLEALQRVGADAQPVRTPEEIAVCEALILPGGESTTIGKLMDRYGLLQPVTDFVASGKPLLGTCAGMILMAKKVGAAGEDQPSLAVMDITVERNAFGRQIDSFEADLDVEGIDGPSIRAVFIRAPIIMAVGPEVQVLARHNGHVVAARQGRMLALSFHPELTSDSRIHQYFLSMR